MSFTSLCPGCGAVLRLLERHRGRKVMCPDCRHPFLAEPADAPSATVPDQAADVPARGWLLVCPACGHVEAVADDFSQRLSCSACGHALAAPTTPSKRLVARRDAGSRSRL